MTPMQRFERILGDLDKLERLANAGKKRHKLLADKLAADIVRKKIDDCRHAMRLMYYAFEDAVGAREVVEA